MAFSFLHGRVHRVLTLGQMDLPDVPQPEGTAEQAVDPVALGI
jgi:hypothetical protein